MAASIRAAWSALELPVGKLTLTEGLWRVDLISYLIKLRRGDETYLLMALPASTLAVKACNEFILALIHIKVGTERDVQQCTGPEGAGMSKEP